VPEEIKGTDLEGLFVEMAEIQNEGYTTLFEKLKEYVFNKHKDLASDEKKHNLLEGFAKEDARYITSLATESQVGLTINARNLELLLRRFASSPLKEVQNLGRAIYAEISEIAPSIVLFYQANDRDLKTYPELKTLAGKLLNKSKKNKPSALKAVELLDYSKDADDIIAAALMHTSSNLSYKQCLTAVKKLPRRQKEEIFKTAWQNLQFYDSMLREFEYVNLTFNIVLSAACFGQLKRHRMSTITVQNYDPALGITIPDSIKQIGRQKYFQDIVEKTNRVYDIISAEKPLIAPYILTNAHRRRVLMHINARELYHLSRLREDTHAQWDIQDIARQMRIQAKEKMPLTFKFTGGKDKYNEIYQNIFGKLPKVTEVKLPEARKIK